MHKRVSYTLFANLGIFSVLIIVFYLSAFLSGYGSSSRHLFSEIKLFTGFLIAHLLTNFYIFFFRERMTLLSSLIIIAEVFLLWGFAAFYFGYFGT
jgi:hypothetical protein